MKIIIKYSIISLIIMLTFTGCLGPGPFDNAVHSYDLPGNYQLFNSARYNHKHGVVIIPKGGYDPSDVVLIDPKVVEIAFDDRYIMAKRYDLIDDPTSDDSDDKIPDTSKEYYYILDSKDLILYGPFNKDEFEHQKKELNIDENIELKDVYEYITK